MNLQIMLVTTAEGPVELRCALCGTVLATAETCRLDTPDRAGGRYVTPIGGTTIDWPELRQSHTFDECRKNAKLIREQAGDKQMLAWLR
ncbi:MAG: hypothetical protein OXG35_21350 [Acidobacteria bacterium]|nr:hypothetical protein [Acidobacteriota bacterium]